MKESANLRAARALAAAVGQANAGGQSDYQMPPLVYQEEGRPVGRIHAGDTAVFCCRRGEREVELTEMFTDPAFDAVPRQWLDNLGFVTLTQYHDKFAHLPTAFPPVKLENTLATCISRAGRTQYHCAESEKFAHVTFFLNGGNNTPPPGETDDQVPSPRVAFVDVPELSAPAVSDKVVEALGQYDFVVVNYANGDVIGHLDSTEAKLATVRCIDAQLERVVSDALDKDYVVLITADHGNLEIMTRPDGTPHVSHTTALVPFIVADARNSGPIDVADGALGNISPTVLQIMGIEQPADMTAGSLTAGHDFGGDRRVLLIILDGWGYGAADETNPIHVAETPFWDALLRERPRAALHASSTHVGLGEGKSGNSEAGHLNIGAGRVVLQDDQRIDGAIADGTFAENPALLAAIDRARTRGTPLHLLALLSEKSSHGSIAYPLAICEMARDLPQVYFHLIVDGRSSAQGSSPGKIMALAEKLEALGTGQIVGCVGRGYALDRDKNYPKVKQAYDALVLGEGKRYGPQDEERC